jgi:predicted nucleic acid-binding protein
MTLVVDASAALKWFIEEDGSAHAAVLLMAPELLIAPDLIVAEVCNAAWKAVRAGTMLPEQQDHAASRLAAAFDELVPMAALARRAAELSRTLDHPAYDCFYLALSEQRDAKLITADRKLLLRVEATEWKALVADLRSLPSSPASLPGSRRN